MLCQNAFLFKFVFSLGYKETIGKISLIIEATNGILVLVPKWRHHAKGLLWVIYHTQPTIPLFWVFKWRHGGHVNVQNNSAKSLLGIRFCYYDSIIDYILLLLNHERHFAMVLFTNMAFSSREWKPRIRFDEGQTLVTPASQFFCTGNLTLVSYHSSVFHFTGYTEAQFLKKKQTFHSKRILHEDANIKIWFSYLLRKTECLAKTLQTFFSV